MKRGLYGLAVCAMMCATAVKGETSINIMKGGEVSYSTEMPEGSKIKFSDGKAVINAQKEVAVADIDSMVFEHFVSIKFEDGKVEVHNPYDSVYITVNGEDVDIDAQTLTHEVRYVVSGETKDGSLMFSSLKKMELELNGASISSKGMRAPIRILTGKNTKLILADGTKNVLRNSENDTTGAAFRSKGQIEIKKGKGSLVVDSKKGHGIQSGDYVEMVSGDVTVYTDNGDGIHVNDYYLQSGGKMNIDLANSQGGDGIDVGEGYVEISGGELTVNTVSDGARAIKSSTDIDETGATVGTGDITISGGKIDLRCKGAGSRVIKADGNIEISGNADMLVLLNGASTYVDSENNTNACGIKATGKMTVNGGNVNVICTADAKSSRAIQADGIISFNGGRTVVHQNAVEKAHTELKRPIGVKSDASIKVTNGEALYIKVPADSKATGEHYVKPFSVGGSVTINHIIFDDIEEAYDELNQTPEDWKYQDLE